MTDGRGAKPNGAVARYFSPDSYPEAARNNGFIGRSTVVLNIDDRGKVSKCRVVVGAGSLLNEATCQNAARILFQPGKSASGKPEPSIYILQVSWQLPG